MMIFQILFVLFCVLGHVFAEESNKQQNPAISPVVQAVAISSIEKDKHGDQSSKILSAVEAQNMLQILDDPAKRGELLKELKKTVKDDGNELITLTSLKNFVLTAHTLISKENIIFLIGVFSRICVVLVIFIFLWHGLNKTVDLYVRRIPKERLVKNQSAAIVHTIAPIVRSTLHWVLIAVTILLILSEFSINIMPIIYSFSVITLAISLGSQTLVKDLINGAMTLFEGNMAVGDYVIIGSFSGVVESISLRCVHLRYGTGELQTIPFSEVNHVINCSRDYSFVDIQFMVSYEADQKDTDAALKAAYEEIKKHPKLGSLIQSELYIFGVSTMNEWGYKVHAGVKTTPDPEKFVINEFNRLLLIQLQKRKIPLPAKVLLASDTKNPKPGAA
ncbi:MAG: mechanosensitive ion channel [Alphaproteobacteria bacterium]|nr:mechanosensitive ion channel [Alphaproteobacteria bacterium]